MSTTFVILFHGFSDKSNKLASKMEANNAIVSILSRKASSTPSLPDATDGNNQKASVASTEQAASADNLAAKVRNKRELFPRN